MSHYVPKAGLAIWLMIVLARKRGVSIGAMGVGPRWARRTTYRFQASTVFSLGVVALIASQYVAKVIHLIFGGHGQPVGPLGIGDVVAETTRSLSAGLMEETILIGFLVTTLEQARQRPWLIVATGLTLRWAFHLYYGAESLHVLVWGSAFLLLFLYTRRLTPLILWHASYDLVVSLAQPRVLGWSAALVIALALCVVALSTVLMSCRRGVSPRLHHYVRK